jgi:heme A synthase
MNPWTFYLIGQLDEITSYLHLLTTFTIAACLVCLVLGSLIAAGEKMESHPFIIGQQIRHWGFRLIVPAIIMVILSAFVPNTKIACNAHPQCQMVTSK